MHKHCTSILIAGAYATLPGASATVNVNFSNISTRLRNQLTHSLEVYPKSVLKVGARLRKLMHFLQEYYGFSASVVDENYISLVVKDFDKHKDIYEEVYTYCKALITANRLAGMSTKMITSTPCVG
jgi:ribosomal protein S17E